MLVARVGGCGEHKCGGVLWQVNEDGVIGRAHGLRHGGCDQHGAAWVLDVRGHACHGTQWHLPWIMCSGAEVKGLVAQSSHGGVGDMV